MTRANPRVLLVTPEYAPVPGGLGDYTAQLATALRAAGASPAILTSHPRHARPASDNEQAPLPVWRRVPRWDWRIFGAVGRAAAAWQADLVHIQYQTGAYRLHPAINLLPWWLRRQRQRPRLVTTFHDLRVPYLLPRAGRLRLAANAALARGSDLAIATNPADWTWLASTARRAALIPIGPNIEPGPETEAIAARLRTGLNLAPHEHLLVTFGLINHSKGLPALLHALARLNDPEAVGRYRLALVGAGDAGLDPTDRTTLQAVKRLAADLNLTDALVWVGQQPEAEVAAWLRTADVVALPYRDGASYRRGTLLAALACGAAVVTTRPGTSPAPDSTPAAPALPALRSGRHALLVPPDDPAALATAVAAVAGDPALAQSLRRGAREIATHFTWPAIAEQTLAAYGSLASKPGAGDE